MTTGIRSPARRNRVIPLLGLMVLLGTGAFIFVLIPESTGHYGNADIIIQFATGEPEEKLREAEAKRLVKAGFADLLYVPALSVFYQAMPANRALSAIRLTDIRPGAAFPGPRPDDEIAVAYFQRIRKSFRIPPYFENTHAELLLAKAAMDACGFRKAILVSSDWHMRRIRLIAGRVFGPAYGIEFSPGRFADSSQGCLSLWRYVSGALMELPKIFWFLIYSLWGHPGLGLVATACRAGQAAKPIAGRFGSYLSATCQPSGKLA